MRSASSPALFSAYAEVFPQKAPGAWLASSFLCLRRGVSLTEAEHRLQLLLFSAYAEVFLDGVTTA